ncbi:hypothetical protein D8674_004238 [Pyrus ussuriensis x Pyrus communis]|uniref:Uncharacterized protein n=1 Tax=Pyrus ussuriensis x Pyrus communis TaxID=2448454 RepID=A0A5N5FJY2_9ROSA|nr:hypothetical protein D8674_004238 [Pyrus ussuriensis x Pyrus communis]
MHLASTFEVPATQNLYPGINNVAGVLHWLKHSGELKYRTLYLFLNPGTSGLRKKQFEGLKCCHLV